MKRYQLAGFTSEQFNEEISWLEATLRYAAIIRCSYKRIEDNTLKSYGIRDVYNMSNVKMREILIFTCEHENIPYIKALIKYFEQKELRRLLFVYMNKGHYWQDYYARYESLESWATYIVESKTPIGPYGYGGNYIATSWEHTKRGSKVAVIFTGYQPSWYHCEKCNHCVIPEDTLLEKYQHFTCGVCHASTCDCLDCGLQPIVTFYKQASHTLVKRWGIINGNWISVCFQCIYCLHCMNKSMSVSTYNRRVEKNSFYNEYCEYCNTPTCEYVHPIE